MNASVSFQKVDCLVHLESRSITLLEDRVRGTDLTHDRQDTLASNTS